MVILSDQLWITFRSNLRKRDVEGFCDFSDYNFIDYLFNYTSKIVWEKVNWKSWGLINSELIN